MIPHASAFGFEQELLSQKKGRDPIWWEHVIFVLYYATPLVLKIFDLHVQCVCPQSCSGIHA